MQVLTTTALLILTSLGGWSFIDLWFTPDQQGRYYFERGQYETAAESFEDPLWKGIAYYYDEKYEVALNYFALLDTPEAHFYLGNCYARMGELEMALGSYDRAIELQPEFSEAQENRELVEALIQKASEEDAVDEAPPGDPTFEADEMKIDEKGEKGKEGEVDEMKLSPEQMAEIWMRNIQTTPADFLRLKFSQQAAGETVRSK